MDDGEVKLTVRISSNVCPYMIVFLELRVLALTLPFDA